jgi:hypothetical protein
VDRVISQSAQYQYVDDNGIVDKYAPGTDPYSTMRMGRLAGGAAAPPGAGGFAPGPRYSAQVMRAQARSMSR